MFESIATTENSIKPILVSVQNYDPFSDFQPEFQSNQSECGDTKCYENLRVLEFEENQIKYNTNQSLLPENGSEIFIKNIDFFKLKNETWVPTLIGLSSVNILLILAFEMFVIYKAFRTAPSRRNLFLGQVLLLGLCMSSAVGLAFVPQTNWVSCTVIRVGLGLGYATTFGTLLVKTVFLLSLHTGVYLPIVYQAFLLFFILLTQIVIDVQWLLHSTPAVINVAENEGAVTVNYSNHLIEPLLMCNHSISSLLYSMAYNVLLITVVSFVSLQIKGHKENFREGLFICITITCTIIVWVVWFIGALLSSQNTGEAFIAFGTVVNALLIFVVMFVPKARQLASLGHECRFLHEHRDDTDSPESMYAPSFVHIKPSLQPLMASKSNSNWNFYKQSSATNDCRVHSKAFKAGTAGIVYRSPNNGVRAVPQPGSRVWRSTFPSSQHSFNKSSNSESGIDYRLQKNSHSLKGQQNLKFFRAPCY